MATFPRSLAVKAFALCALTICLSSVAHAQATPGWPSGKPITLIVGYPPGGSVDFVARTVAEQLAKRLKTQVLIENAAGAGGTNGAQKVVNAAPDGTTLLLGSGSEVSIARIYNSAVKYNGETDLTHIGLIGVAPMVFVAAPRVKVKTLDDALAASKRDPNSASFASSGIGTPLHIAGELLNLRAGTNFRHIPYRGAAQMVQDIIGGNIEYGMLVLSSALPHIRAGKMTALGITSASRSRAAPEIAPIADHPKLKGYDMNVWFGLFGPAKLPPAMTARLNTELNEVLRMPEVWKKLQDAGVSTEGGTPQDLTRFIKTDTLKARSVVVQAVTTPTGS